jgi:hypothetical protein
VQPLGITQHFMEPEGSLPSSQELSTCTYPEPDQSSPQTLQERLKQEDFPAVLRAVGGPEITQENIQDWLKQDEGDLDFSFQQNR